MKAQPFLSLVLALSGFGCSSFTKPEPFDEGAIRERSVSKTKDGVRVSGALLLPEEIERIFGVDLRRRAIQPVWLELENRSGRQFHFLVTGVDPGYFPPLEVSYGFHSFFSPGANEQLDRHLTELCFNNRSPIKPGETVSGFVYTNQSWSTKVVDIDLLGRKWMTNITLFIPDPADREVTALLAAVLDRFSGPELVRISGEEELRKKLEGLPCCARSPVGEHVAPLNIVVLGDIDEWVSAFQRRGYRYQKSSPLYAFQRAQDVDAAKRARWIGAQPQVIRFWQTPLRYESPPIWIGQASSPLGGRFTRDAASIDPAFDGARDTLVEDLIYSQNLVKIGFLKGGGCELCKGAGKGTDGLRVLMIFKERMVGLDQIDFFDWERLADSR